jgi:hypothetical protein
MIGRFLTYQFSDLPNVCRTPVQCRVTNNMHVITPSPRKNLSLPPQCLALQRNPRWLRQVFLRVFP